MWEHIKCDTWAIKISFVRYKQGKVVCFTLRYTNYTFVNSINMTYNPRNKSFKTGSPKRNMTWVDFFNFFCQCRFLKTPIKSFFSAIECYDKFFSQSQKILR